MKKVIRPSQFGSCYQDYLEKSNKIYKELEVVTLNYNQKQWDHFNSYSSQKIINLTELTKKNEDFLPILAFDMERMSKYFKITSILRPVPFLTLEDIIMQEKNLKQSQMGGQLANLIVLISNKCIEIARKHQQILDLFHSSCFQCCIQQQNCIFKVSIAFRDIKLAGLDQENGSCEDFIEHLHKIIVKMSLKLGFQFKNSTESKIQAEQLSLFSPLLNQIKLKQYPQKQAKEKQLKCFSFKFYEKTMSNFTDHVFDMIHSTIDGLTKIVHAQNLEQNHFFDEQIICAFDPTTKKSYQGEIYHNINCSHFEGLSFGTYSSQKRCPICGQKLVFNAERANQVGRNVFQMLLLRNPLNPHSLSVNYHFKPKAFTLKPNSYTQKFLDKFSSFYHFQNYIKRTKNVHDRNEVKNYHKYQSISLYNKIEGKKKFYHPSELISTPVRGKYCHHWQFYDLKKVYSELLKKKTSSFDCLVCLQQTNADQIIYLQEMSHLIALARQYFTVSIDIKQWRCFINVDHQEKMVALSCIQNGKNTLRQVHLGLYDTMLDPLSKSRYSKEFWEEQNLQLNAQFCRFFFGK